MRSTWRSELASQPSKFLGGLSLFSDLTADELSELAWTAMPFALAAGESLCRQGESADEMYCIEAGTVRITVTVAGGGEQELAVLGPGAVLGETSLVGGGLRAATATAVEPVSGFSLHRRAFEVLRASHRPGACKVIRRLAGLVSERLADSVRVDAGSNAAVAAGEPPDLGVFRGDKADLDRDNLLLMPILEDFSRDELEALLGELHRLDVPRGTVLFREGDRPGSCFITLRGAVEIYVDTDAGKRKLALQGPGAMFGEASLFAGRPRSATCRTREDSILLEMEATTFQRLFEEQSVVAFKFFDGATRILVDLMRRAAERQTWFEAERRALQS